METVPNSICYGLVRLVPSLAFWCGESLMAIVAGLIWLLIEHVLLPSLFAMMPSSRAQRRRFEIESHERGHNEPAEIIEVLRWQRTRRHNIVRRLINTPPSPDNGIRRIRRSIIRLRTPDSPP